MSKRFTATDKWNDAWYRSLPCNYRDFWQVILDLCDNSGVWKKDMALSEFYLGDRLDENHAITLFNSGKERIIILDGGSYWLVKDFISFQYGELCQESRVHQSILKVIHRHTLSIGYPKGIYTLKEKDKEKDKDNTTKPVDNFKAVNNYIEKRYINGEITLEDKNAIFETLKKKV